MNLSLACIIGSIIVFALVVFGVDLGLTPVELTGAGLALFAAGHLPLGGGS